MFFSINVDQIINSFSPIIIGQNNWKQYLHQTNRIAACFCFEIRLYKNEYVPEYRKEIHIIVTQKPEIFYSVMDFGETPGINDYHFGSDHPSCWLESGLSFLKNEYAKMSDGAQQDDNFSYSMSLFNQPRKSDVQIETYREVPSGLKKKRIKAFNWQLP